MPIESFKFRSSIHSALKRYSLLKGSLIAAIGIIPLILAGTLIPAAQLAPWGMILFLFGIGMVALGLIPYRKLCRLELCPDELIIDADNSLTYLKQRKLLVTIPSENIDKISYIDDPYHYGIALTFNSPTTKKIAIHDVRMGRKHLRKGQNEDLFLPYFSKRTYKELKEYFRDQLEISTS